MNRGERPVGMLSLTSLRLFVAVADELSLTRAAEREHLVLPAVSKRIKELEGLLGAQLLYRSRRGVVLTPAGHCVIAHARQMMDAVGRMRNEVAEYAQGVAGFVRVHVTTASVTQYLPDELASFMAGNPQVKVDLQDGASTTIVRAIADGRADVGIVDSATTLHGLQSLPYHSHRLVVVVPKCHPLSRKQSVDIRDVVEFDLIGTPSNSSLHALITRAAAESGVTVKFRMQLRGLDGICRMIKADLGIGILPAPAVVDNVSSMSLLALPIDGAWASRASLVCFRNRAGLSPAARELAQHLSTAANRAP
ncbi:MAG: LysR family transcriptional regulator [Proteobacteria bacterium]|nr:LysR family transcriptional regulator [Burkholderiales bacterium]